MLNAGHFGTRNVGSEVMVLRLNEDFQWTPHSRLAILGAASIALWCGEWPDHSGLGIRGQGVNGWRRTTLRRQLKELGVRADHSDGPGDRCRRCD